MAVQAVPSGVVKEVGAEREHYDGRGDHTGPERARQDPRDQKQSNHKIRGSGEAGEVRVQPPEPIARQVPPARQQVGEREERRDQDRHANRMRVDPRAGGRPPDDCRVCGELSPAAIRCERGQRRIAVDEDGGQIDVIADRVRPDRGGSQPAPVNPRVREHCQHARRCGRIHRGSLRASGADGSGGPIENDSSIPRGVP